MKATGRETGKETRAGRPRPQVPPTAAEVAEYAAGIGYAIDAGHFCDYWEARGWEVRPRIKMKDWRAAVRNWRRQAASWAAEKNAPQKPDAAEIDAHREGVAEGVAKQLLGEMLFWVRLSRQDDDEGRERRAEAREKIAETAARAKRLGGKRALDLLREAVKEMLTRRRGGAEGENGPTIQRSNDRKGGISRSEGGAALRTGKDAPEGRGAICNGFATPSRGRCRESDERRVTSDEREKA